MKLCDMPRQWWSFLIIKSKGGAIAQLIPAGRVQFEHKNRILYGTQHFGTSTVGDKIVVKLDDGEVLRIGNENVMRIKPGFLLYHLNSTMGVDPIGISPHMYYPSQMESWQVQPLRSDLKPYRRTQWYTPEPKIRTRG